MKTIHLALNASSVLIGVTKHFENVISWVRDGIVSVDNKEYDLSNSMLEIALKAVDGMKEPEILIWTAEKIKTAPVYVREHNSFTIGCLYYNSSEQEFYIVTTDKYVKLNFKAYVANVVLKGFPNVSVRYENVGINTSVVKIIENTVRKFWCLEETDAQYPFHSKFNHFRKKRLFDNHDLTHFIGEKEVNTVRLSINRNYLVEGNELYDFNHIIIPDGCEYELSEKYLTIHWGVNSSIEIIPKKVDRMLINGHSIQIDTGYTRIRLAKQ